MEPNVMRDRSRLARGGCWEWAGLRSKAGYGVTRAGGRRVMAHRLSWELASGQAIPEGMVICHKCDNPPCVNPEHLFLGTPGDNIRDCAAKGRLRSQRVTACPQGHEYTPENSYRDTRGARMCRVCANARDRLRHRMGRRSQLPVFTTCPECGKEAKSPLGMAQHLRRSHPTLDTSTF